MTTNSAALASLSHVCGVELRFAELVQLKYVTVNEQKKNASIKKKCYLGVGKHALHLIRKDLSAVLPGGQLYYAHLEQVIEDVNTFTDLCIVLNENRPTEWDSTRIFFQTGHRPILLSFLKTTWCSDYMWRFAQVATFPHVKAELAECAHIPVLQSESNSNQKTPAQPRPKARAGKASKRRQLFVAPFAGFHEEMLGDYFFYLPDSFTHSRVNGNRTTYVNDLQRVTIEVFVHPKASLMEMAFHNKDLHVRWVALDYKSFLTSSTAGGSSTNMRGRHWQIFKSQVFLKKMDLSEDIAQFTGWELELECKSTGEYISAVFLRRQFLPPLLDTAQDVAIILRHMKLTNEKPFGLMEPQEIQTTLSSWVHMAANSFSPLMTQLTSDALLEESEAQVTSLTDFIYRDVVQAKMNALLYSEEAFHWLLTRYKLAPGYVPFRTGGPADEGTGSVVLTLEEEGKRFLKGVLKVLNDENALKNPEVLREIGDHIPTVQDPFFVAQDLYRMARFRTGVVSADQTSGSGDARRNAWLERVSKYFCYQINHCCGARSEKFNLAVLVDSCINGHLQADARRKILRVVQFLLHLRPRNYAKPFSESGALLMPLKDMDAVTTSDGDGMGSSIPQGYTFNQTVMQVLVESLFLYQEVCQKNDADYAELLKKMLCHRMISLQLKATICRQIIDSCALAAADEQQPGEGGGGGLAMPEAGGGDKDEGDDEEQHHSANSGTFRMTQAFLREIVPSLIDIMKDPDNTFLQALATAALVNLSNAFSFIKNMLIFDLDTQNSTSAEGGGGQANQSSVLFLLENNLFRRKDDHVVEYTLLLLVNLTTTAKLREVILKQQTLLPELVDTLLTHYATPFSSYKLLIPLNAILGQLANDDDIRAHMQEVFGMSILDCCLFMFDAVSGQKPFETSNQNLPLEDFQFSAKVVAPLKSKLYFVLKQLCVNSSKNKATVGSRTLEGLCLEFRQIYEVYNDLELNNTPLGRLWSSSSATPGGPPSTSTLLDMFINLATLLTLLAIHKRNLRTMIDSCGLLEFLNTKKIATHTEVIVEKITNLRLSISAGIDTEPG
ncbi:unnamed protein product [Amoebophrya sp. A120]|nr:unnamed protein product [Amoebophrya sp. A120]|eukprot:GSA120T00017366001.1